MRTIQRYMTALYFLICPLELVFNIVFTSSTKYIGIVLLATWSCSIIANYDNATTELTKYLVSLFVWIMYATLATLTFGIHSSRSVDYLVTYISMGLLVFACTQVDWKPKDVDFFIFAYYVGSVIMAVLVILWGETQYVGRTSVMIFGRFSDPNQIAASIVPGAFIGLHYGIQKTGIHNKFFFYSGMLAVAYAVLETGSRGGLLSLIIGMLIFLIVNARKGRFSIVYVLLFLVFGVVALHFLPEDTISRLLNIGSYTDSYANGDSRIDTWIKILSTFDAKWLTGHGVGSSISFYLDLTGKASGIHNTFIWVLYEVGIFGFSFFIYPFVGLLIENIRKENAIYVAILSGALVSSFFLDSLNLRYLWNGLILALIAISVDEMNHESHLYDPISERRNVCKYIK